MSEEDSPDDLTDASASDSNEDELNDDKRNKHERASDFSDILLCTKDPFLKKDAPSQLKDLNTKTMYVIYENEAQILNYAHVIYQNTVLRESVISLVSIPDKNYIIIEAIDIKPIQNHFKNVKIELFPLQKFVVNFCNYTLIPSNIVNSYGSFAKYMDQYKPCKILAVDYQSGFAAIAYQSDHRTKAKALQFTNETYESFLNEKYVIKGRLYRDRVFIGNAVIDEVHMQKLTTWSTDIDTKWLDLNCHEIELKRNEEIDESESDVEEKKDSKFDRQLIEKMFQRVNVLNLTKKDVQFEVTANKKPCKNNKHFTNKLKAFIEKAGSKIPDLNDCSVIFPSTIRTSVTYPSPQDFSKMSIRNKRAVILRIQKRCLFSIRFNFIAHVSNWGIDVRKYTATRYHETFLYDWRHVACKIYENMCFEIFLNELLTIKRNSSLVNFIKNRITQCYMTRDLLLMMTRILMYVKHECGFTLSSNKESDDNSQEEFSEYSSDESNSDMSPNFSMKTVKNSEKADKKSKPQKRLGELQKRIKELEIRNSELRGSIFKVGDLVKTCVRQPAIITKISQNKISILTATNEIAYEDAVNLLKASDDGSVTDSRGSRIFRGDHVLIIGKEEIYVVIHTYLGIVFIENSNCPNQFLAKMGKELIFHND